MIKPSCSYFLKLTGLPRDLKKAREWLTKNEIVPYILAPDEPGDPASETYSVPGGACNQWTGMEDVLIRLSENVPALRIQMGEQNEEPYCPDRFLEILNGKTTADRYGRRIAPGEFDQETVHECARILMKNGKAGAAELILKSFPNP